MHILHQFDHRKLTGAIARELWVIGCMREGSHYTNESGTRRSMLDKCLNSNEPAFGVDVKRSPSVVESRILYQGMIGQIPSIIDHDVNTTKFRLRNYEDLLKRL